MKDLHPLGEPSFYRLFPGFRGGFYKIWPGGAYELIVFAYEDLACLYLNAVHTDDGRPPEVIARIAQPITRAEYEAQVTRVLNWPEYSILARPAAEDWEIRQWRLKMGF